MLSKIENLDILDLNNRDRSRCLLEKAKHLFGLFGEPLKGSDRWVYMDDEYVYKLPSPYSYGHGQAGVFANCLEAEQIICKSYKVARSWLVYWEDVPLIIMERVVPIDMDNQLGISQGGEVVVFDAGSLPKL